MLRKAFSPWIIIGMVGLVIALLEPHPGAPLVQPIFTRFTRTPDSDHYQDPRAVSDAAWDHRDPAGFSDPYSPAGPNPDTRYD